MADLLKRHLKLLSDSLKNDVSAMRKRCDKKAIHRFRISVKKQRAYFQLLDYVSSDSGNTGKEFYKLRKLFKQAGKVRVNQKHADIMKEFNLPTNDDTLAEEKIAETKARQRFAQKLKKFNAQKTIDKLAQKTSERVNEIGLRKITADILNFSKRNMAKAIKLAEKEKLHAARMKLKTAHYCLELIGQKPVAAALIATIDPIEQKTGRWHDCAVTLEILIGHRKIEDVGKKPKMKKDAPPEMILKEITTLETQIQKDFRRLKRIIA